MREARYWHGGTVVLAWLVVPSCLVLIRWLLVLGVYQVALQGQRVIRLSGVWSPTFASGLLVALVAVGGVSLLGLTYTWLSASKERAALDLGLIENHRRPLV
jgi:hypothetical protein